MNSTKVLDKSQLTSSTPSLPAACLPVGKAGRFLISTKSPAWSCA
ncbi:MAG: hypothetical protein WBG58_01910 [Ignavibacteriaceae bacterium]